MLLLNTDSSTCITLTSRISPEAIAIHIIIIISKLCIVGMLFVVQAHYIPNNIISNLNTI